MSVGERIKFFRNLRGMTQKYLGMRMGFPERGADVRMAQYESNTRTPKEDLTKALAKELEVAPMALDIPPIESELGMIHTLFALEDIYGFKVAECNGEICLRLTNGNSSIFATLQAWCEQAKKLEAGEITKEEYDQWRYRYPELDKTQVWAKLPPKDLSDFLIKKFAPKHKD